MPAAAAARVTVPARRHAAEGEPYISDIQFSTIAWTMLGEK